MREVIGATIGARTPMGVPAAVKTTKLTPAVIAIACLALAACGPQPGTTSSAGSPAPSARAWSASSATAATAGSNGQVGTVQGSLPDACGILTQARVATMTGVADITVKSSTAPMQLPEDYRGFAKGTLFDGCQWTDETVPHEGPQNGYADLFIFRDPNNADILGSLKTFLNNTADAHYVSPALAEYIPVSGIGDNAVKFMTIQDGYFYFSSHHFDGASVAFVKGHAGAVITVGSTKKSAQAIETEEEMILHEVANGL